MNSNDTCGQCVYYYGNLYDCEDFNVKEGENCCSFWEEQHKNNIFLNFNLIMDNAWRSYCWHVKEFDDFKKTGKCQCFKEKRGE